LNPEPCPFPDPIYKPEKPPYNTSLLISPALLSRRQFHFLRVLKMNTFAIADGFRANAGDILEEVITCVTTVAAGTPRMTTTWVIWA
jgi:hypothetical protein